MSRTLYQRVIADRFGSATRDGARRRRGARNVDLDVARSRREDARLPSTTVRHQRIF